MSSVVNKGIDVSKWQGNNVDFKKVKKAGYSFVMINAGYGKYAHQKDECFETNYKKAKLAGLKVGAYWYSYALTEAEAKEEAKVFIEAIKNKTFEMPIAFDIEDSSQTKLSQDTIGKIINAFCSYCESKNYFVMLYSYADFLNNKVPSSCKTKYSVWLAEFDKAKPTVYKGNYDMWQYTSKGSVSGVSGNCDCNNAYKDFTKIIKEKGFNGFPKTPIAVPTAKTMDTKGFKSGDDSLGVLAFKELIALAKKKGLHSVNVDENSIFGDGTKKAVNTLLKKWGYKENGIAGTNFIKKLKSVL